MTALRETLAIGDFARYLRRLLICIYIYMKKLIYTYIHKYINMFMYMIALRETLAIGGFARDLRRLVYIYIYIYTYTDDVHVYL
jgi:hypothetical protein